MTDHVTRKSIQGSPDTLGSRIYFALSAVPTDESVQATGKSWKQLTRYAGGAEVPLSVILTLSEATGIRHSWLIDGLGPVWQEEKAKGGVVDDYAVHEGDIDQIIELPVLAMHQGLPGTKDKKNDSVALHSSFLSSLKVRLGECALMLQPNHKILLIDLSPNQNAISGRQYVIAANEELNVRRIIRRADGSIDLVAGEPGAIPETYKPDDFARLSLVGRVVWSGEAV